VQGAWVGGIFKRRNPGTAEDGSVQVFILTRAIFKRRNPGAKNGPVELKESPSSHLDLGCWTGLLRQ